jgi:YVTN family beta-propeller protein
MAMRRTGINYITFLATVYSVLAATTLCAATLQQEPIKQYFPEPVYVALQASGAIEVLPQRTVWEGFPQAHYVAVGPAGKLLVISGFGTGQVYVADAQTGRKLGTLKIGDLVQGVKIDPGGRLALATDTAGDSVKVIDLKTIKITKTIPVGKSPHNIVFSPDGKLAYVTVQGANKLAVVDMSSFKKIADIDIPGLDGPHNLDLSNNGHWIWIRSHASATQHGDVALLDLASRRVLESIPVGLFHGGIDGVGDSVIVTTSIGSATVDVIDRNALGVIKQIKVGAGPHGVRLSPDGRWAYVTSTIDNEVDVIDMQSLKLVQRIKMDGIFPFWIALVGNS